MKKKKHLYISGRVQGVGFRAYTKKEAEKLGLKGWVKNLADGRVEAIIVGANEQMKQLLNSLKTGPAFAKVEQIEIATKEYKDEFDNFEIRY